MCPQPPHEGGEHVRQSMTRPKGLTKVGGMSVSLDGSQMNAELAPEGSRRRGACPSADDLPQRAHEGREHVRQSMTYPRGLTKAGSMSVSP